MSSTSGNGYLYESVPGHPLADARGRVYQHILVAERALAKRGLTLPPEAVVHHSNRDKTDNRSCNLVVCPDQAYHALLHRRMRAKAACGYADWFKCKYCRKWDAPGNLCVFLHESSGQGPDAFHRECDNFRKRGNRERIYRRLTSEQVATIRVEYAAGVKQKEIATKYNASISTISQLVNGKTWRGQ